MKGVIRKPLAVLVTVALLMLLLTSLGYAAKDTRLMKHWHPMFVEAVLGYFGISFFGHDHTRHSHKVEDGAFVRAPITSCWKYDFLEADCDGPDHYKAFVADGERPDSRIRAYMGDRGDPRTSPVRAKACGMSTEHVYCVSDYSDDGKIVWRETHHNLDKHMLTIGCPGPRKELPCVSRD